MGWEAVSACSCGGSMLPTMAQCVLATPVTSPGLAWPRAAPWAPCSSAESSWLHLLAQMWLLPRGIFAEDLEEHIQPSMEKGEWSSC